MFCFCLEGGGAAEGLGTGGEGAEFACAMSLIMCSACSSRVWVISAERTLLELEEELEETPLP